MGLNQDINKLILSYCVLPAGRIVPWLRDNFMEEFYNNSDLGPTYTNFLSESSNGIIWLHRHNPDKINWDYIKGTTVDIGKARKLIDYYNPEYYLFEKIINYINNIINQTNAIFGSSEQSTNILIFQIDNVLRDPLYTNEIINALDNLSRNINPLVFAGNPDDTIIDLIEKKISIFDSLHSPEGLRFAMNPNPRILKIIREFIQTTKYDRQSLLFYLSCNASKEASDLFLEIYNTEPSIELLTQIGTIPSTWINPDMRFIELFDPIPDMYCKMIKATNLNKNPNPLAIKKFLANHDITGPIIAKIAKNPGALGIISDAYRAGKFTNLIKQAPEILANPGIFIIPNISKLISKVETILEH